MFSDSIITLQLNRLHWLDVPDEVDKYIGTQKVKSIRTNKESVLFSEKDDAAHGFLTFGICEYNPICYIIHDIDGVSWFKKEREKLSLRES